MEKILNHTNKDKDNLGVPLAAEGGSGRAFRYKSSARRRLACGLSAAIPHAALSGFFQKRGRGLRLGMGLFLIFFILSFQLTAQIFPVQVSTQLIPPYSVYLPDYAVAGSDKLRLIIVQKDLVEPSYSLRLHMTVEWNGKVIMRTSPQFMPTPIVVSPGVPTIIGGTELAPYLDSKNIDFTGYSREQYERTRSLPEGSYKICFTAFDYGRPDVQVSNEGCNFYFFSKNEPPLINMPACGSKINMLQPQQVIFNWLPRNTASPNSVVSTEYELSLYEVRPKGRNPNDIVLSTAPVYKVKTDLTTWIYGPADPPLLEDMQYAWRVQAIDKEGRDQFRNQGFSEVCTFFYGGNSSNNGNDIFANPDAVKNLQAQGEGERKAKIWWKGLNGVDGYKVYYKKAGSGYEWFSQEVQDSSIWIFDLEPGTTYETRVQASKAGFFGAYSDIVQFSTSPKKVYNCGDGANVSPGSANGKPLTSLLPNSFITYRDFEIQVKEAMPDGGDGWYKGAGSVSLPFMLGKSFAVTFEKIYIDESKTVTSGEIHFVSDDLKQWINKVKDHHAGGDDVGKVKTGADTTDLVINFTLTEFTKVTVKLDSTGNIISVTIEGPDGPVTMPTAPSSTITIKDKDGNIFEVDKNGNVTQIGTTNTVLADLFTNGGIVVNSIDSKTGQVKFTPHPQAQYAFDEWKLIMKGKRIVEQEYEAITTTDNDTYYVPAKAIVPGKTDKVLAQVTLNNTAFKADSVIFATAKGLVLKATATQKAGEYELTLTGGPAGDAQEIYALYPLGNNKYVTLGKLLVASYDVQTKKVVLIPYKNVSVDKQVIVQQLNKIYKGVGIEWEVTVDDPFTDDSWDEGKDGKLNIQGSGWFSQYTAEMKALNKAYKAKHDIDKNTAYLFILPEGIAGTENNVAGSLLGDMPRGKQFGYLFSKAHNGNSEQMGITAGHELAHGVFNLLHVFDAQVGLSKGSTGSNLMDYPSSTHLYKYQWDQLHDPGVVTAVFESDEDGESIGGFLEQIPASYKNNGGSFTCLTPSGTVVTIPKESTKIYYATADPYYYKGTTIKSGSIAPIGSLIAFTIGDNYYNYQTEGNNAYYKCERCSFDQRYYKDSLSKKIAPVNAIVGFPYYQNNSLGIDLLKYQIKDGERINDDGDNDPNSIKIFGTDEIQEFYTIIDKTKTLTSNQVNEYGLAIFNLYQSNNSIHQLPAVSFPSLSDYAKNFLNVNSNLTRSGSPLAAGIISCAYWFSQSEAYEGNITCTIDQQNDQIATLKQNMSNIYADPEGPAVSIEWQIDQEKTKLFYALFYRYRDLIKNLQTVNHTANDINTTISSIQSADELDTKISELNPCVLELISIDNRIKAIEKLEPGNYEESIIKLIYSIKYNTQGAQLISRLFDNKSNLFRKLWNRIDFSEFHQYISKVTELVQINANPASISFSFARGGDNFYDYKFESDGSVVIIKKEHSAFGIGEVGGGGNIPWEIDRVSFKDLTQMVKVTFPLKDSYIEWEENQTTDITIELPAYYIAYLIQKRKTDDAFKAARVIGNLVAIAAAIPTGGQSITIASGISIGLATTDLVVMYNESSLQQSEAGKIFLDAWQVAQLMDAGFAVTNIARSGYKALCFKFENFIADLATLNSTEKSKVISALRRTPQILMDFGQSSLSRMFATKITARFEALLLQNMFKITRGTELKFLNWVEGFIHVEGVDIKLFEIGLSSNGGYIRLSKPLENVTIQERIIGSIEDVRYFDETTGTIKEGSFEIAYNPTTKSARIANHTNWLSKLDDLHFTDLRDKINLLGEAKRRFLIEFANASVDELRLLNAETDLIDVWKRVSYLTSEAKDIGFLKALKKVEADNVWKHIEGETFSGTSAVGGHILSNVRKVNVGSEYWIYSDKIRFKVLDIQLPNPWSEGMEIMKARKIQIFDGTQWVSKNGGGVSSFFPSTWSKQKILEETALAFKKAQDNPSIYWTGSGNAYDVLSSDGSLKIRFFYGVNGETNTLINGSVNPIIKSSFPSY